MKKDKELIDEIVHRLRNQEDIPYRDGAWERFRTMETATHTRGVAKTLIKYLSAAAVLLISFATYLLIEKNSIEVVPPTGQEVVLLEESKRLHQDKETPKNTVVPADKSGLSEAVQPKESPKTEIVKKAQLASIDYVENDKPSSEVLPALVLNKSDIKKIDLPLTTKGMRVRSETLPSSHSSLASNQIEKPNLQNYQHSGALQQTKSWKFQEKFDFGLFVSPYTQSETFKVGGGFTMAYNLSNKISIRTGASYNSYEVGILKNPLASSSVEEVNAKVTNSGLQEGSSNVASIAVSKMTIPNISAITGFVNSIEIPLEFKYNVNRGLYATAGISYSTIVNQERNALYIQNVDNITFKNGFPENEKQASQALEVVTKSIKSSEQNVSTSGYSGFINLSLGKKVTINRKFGFSVEPYYKIPVGEFKHSDMSYNNGGVRIITNF